MSLPNLDGKYSSGKRRIRLFRDKRKPGLPISIILLAVIALLFWLIPVNTLQSNNIFSGEDLTLPPPTPTDTPVPTPTSLHGGRIVFTCTRGDFNQICMVNADGSDYEQVTDTNRNDYYPVFTPDGLGIVFASNRNGSFDLYMLVLSNDKLFQLTNNIGNAFSPKFSPDGKQILFLNRAAEGPSALWVMGALGENPQLLYAGTNTIVAADWSPDGHSIAFAMAVDQPNAYEIFLLDASQTGQPPRRLTQGIEGITGSLDWSPDGQSLLICAGSGGDKNVFRFDLAPGTLTQLTFGGNNAAASYSPDGQYIVFNSLRNSGQADLFIIRADGHSTRLLVDNPEPDWQPQWGP